MAALLFEKKKMDLHNIRQDYSKQELSPEQCASNPITQFEMWLQDAMHAQVPEPTAMNVASIDVDGRPSSRVVLLKEVNAEGFVFFSNYHSRKGQALAAKSLCCVEFFFGRNWSDKYAWKAKVFRLPEKLSDEYFASRPYTSRVGAWASEQSHVIENKSVLLARAAMFATKHP